MKSKVTTTIPDARIVVVQDTSFAIVVQLSATTANTDIVLIVVGVASWYMELYSTSLMAVATKKGGELCYVQLFLY